MADITDPGAMRALAHPLRIRMLEALATRGESTATELSELVHESPSNCSFHLRKLAEFGYIERADDASGRQKPWRVVDPTQNFLPDPDDPIAMRASTAVGSAFREWDIARLRASEGRPNPRPWKRSTFQLGSTMYVTPDEARLIEQKLHDALAPYLDRLSDPTLRPEGAGLVRLFAATTYLPEYQERIDRESAERRARSDRASSPDAS